MIKKFQMQGARGAAGQSTGPQSARYNFANLYSLNRDNGARAQRDLSGFQERANQVQQSMGQAKALSQRGGAGGMTDQVKGQMADAVKRAKGISDQAQAYSPAAQAMKQGLSGYQSQVQSFYSGGANSQAAKGIRKFGGLYNEMLNQQSGIINAGNKPIEPTSIRPAGQPGPGLAQTAMDQVDKTNALRNKKQGPGTGSDVRKTRNMDNLSWMLKTGRITTQQYYRAINDDAFYTHLMDTKS